MVRPRSYESLPTVHEEHENDYDTGQEQQQQQQQQNSLKGYIEVAALTAKLADTAIMMMSEDEDRDMLDVYTHTHPETVIDEEMEDLSFWFARA